MLRPLLLLFGLSICCAVGCQTKATSESSDSSNFTSSNEKASATERKKETNSKPEKEITNSIGMKLVLISKGTFQIGSLPEKFGSLDNASPHKVTLTRDYYLDAFEVTQAQYSRVMGKNPSKFQGDEVAERDTKTGRVVKLIDTSNHPVEQVSWAEVVDFCRKLSELPEEKQAGRVYRLPTEAEWEYACRAGSKTAYCFGESPELLGDYAWYMENSKYQSYPLRENQTQSVGKKKPNAWGLYDMHGNVQEWCSDWYGEYPKGAVTDPIGPEQGSDRVFRGGAYWQPVMYHNSAVRFRLPPYHISGSNGFRVAMSVPEDKK